MVLSADVCPWRAQEMRFLWVSQWTILSFIEYRAFLWKIHRVYTGVRP